MATAAPQHQAPSALPSPTLDRETSRRASVPTSMTMPSTQHAPAAAPSKKAKGKKAADPSEQAKQIQAKIAQLELDAAGDREQEAEIGACYFRYARQQKAMESAYQSMLT